MTRRIQDELPRRQRQVYEVLHRRGPSTAAEVMAALPDPLSNSTVRTTLRILETKGHVRHREVDGQFVYEPATPPAVVRRAALRHVVQTFFSGSAADAMASLLGSARDVSDDELAEMEAMIARAREARR